MNTTKELPILDCQGCGVCCFHMAFPAFNLGLAQLQSIAHGDTIDENELGPAARADLKRWADMPTALRSELLKVMEAYNPPIEGRLDEVCVWLDSESRLCKHHTHRPQVCRDFEIGCQQCLDWRKHYQDRIS